MKQWKSPRGQFILSLLAASAVSVGLYGYGALRNHEFEFSYLVWNLFLGWLPLIFAVQLVKTLRHKLWSSWPALGWSALWVLFLPNSFYMISDFIHLRDVPRVDIVYDAVMFTAFIFTSLVIGFSSLLLVHAELKRRFTGREAAGWVGLTLLASSVAIYIGRDLRWNSWDVVTNPGGLLFDISDRVQHPSTYPQMLITILSFFVLLSSMYFVLWRAATVLRAK